MKKQANARVLLLAKHICTRYDSVVAAAATASASASSSAAVAAAAGDTQLLTSGVYTLTPPRSLEGVVKKAKGIRRVDVCVVRRPAQALRYH